MSSDVWTCGREELDAYTFTRLNAIIPWYLSLYT